MNYLVREYEKLLDKQAREIEIARTKVINKYKARLEKIKKAARELDRNR
jgi:hypothetical protein